MEGLELSNTCKEAKLNENLHLLLMKNLSKFSINEEKVKVCKRSRDLHDGDYSVPKGILPKLQPQNVNQLKQDILEESQQWPWPVRDVVAGVHYPLAFHLQRSVTLKNVLSSILRPETMNVSHNRGSLVINNSNLHMSNSRNENVTLATLRSFILMQHLAELLKANGFTVQFTSTDHTHHHQEYLQLLNFDTSCISNGNDMSGAGNVKELLSIARTRGSKYLLKNTGSIREKAFNSSSATEKDNNADNEGSKVDLMEDAKERLGQESESERRRQNHSSSMCNDGELSLDLQIFLDENKIGTGKRKYDKNLSVSVVEDANGPTKTLEQVLCLQNTSEKVSNCETVLHIEADKDSFVQQKVDLTWRILSENCPRQIHLVYGPVQSRKSASLDIDSASDFYRLRYEQMKEASVMKYGSQVQGAGWEETIKQLTVASIKFEMLSCSYRNSVKLDLSEGNEFGGGIDNRAGAFVMYNYARLATLFKHFTQAVQKGTYPPLPAIEEINFSTLREEDEWSLFFLFIFPYTDLVEQTVEELYPDDGEIFSKIQTHKIANFLISLSRRLSCYYSRTHVLVENREKLLPIMYARLYLLKAVYKIMQYALSLMGIMPLTQL